MTMFWGAALESLRVNEDVEECRGQREQGAENVHERAQNDESHYVQRNSEPHGVLRRDAAADYRASRGASHESVYVAVQIVVEGVRAPCGQRSTAQYQYDEKRVGNAPSPKEHAPERREHQQGYYPRLGEGYIPPQCGI